MGSSYRSGPWQGPRILPRAVGSADGSRFERVLRNEICAHLGASGWLYEEGAAARYDRARALFPEDLRDWLKDAQPKVWEALEKAHGAAALMCCATGSN
jgi:hypothetical protein